MRSFKAKKSILLTGLGISMLLTSCATLMQGTYQSVGIASHPSNANIWVDRNFVGVTPLIVDMSRKDNHIVRIELDGFHSYEAVFTRKLSGWVFGNIVFGGVIGLAIDAISGGIYMLTPDQIQAELQSNSITVSKMGQDSYITVVLSPDPSWKKIGDLAAAD